MKDSRRMAVARASAAAADAAAAAAARRPTAHDDNDARISASRPLARLIKFLSHHPTGLLSPEQLSLSLPLFVCHQRGARPICHAGVPLLLLLLLVVVVVIQLANTSSYRRRHTHAEDHTRGHWLTTLHAQ